MTSCALFQHVMRCPAIPANTRHSLKVGPMLDHRLRRWSNIEPTVSRVFWEFPAQSVELVVGWPHAGQQCGVELPGLSERHCWLHSYNILHVGPATQTELITLHARLTFSKWFHQNFCSKSWNAKKCFTCQEKHLSCTIFFTRLFSAAGKYFTTIRRRYLLL